MTNRKQEGCKVLGCGVSVSFEPWNLFLGREKPSLKHKKRNTLCVSNGGDKNVQNTKTKNSSFRSFQNIAKFGWVYFFQSVIRPFRSVFRPRDLFFWKLGVFLNLYTWVLNFFSTSVRSHDTLEKKCNDVSAKSRKSSHISLTGPLSEQKHDFFSRIRLKWA